MNKQEPVLDAASLTKYVITEQKINFYEAGKFENREHPTHASIVKRNWLQNPDDIAKIWPKIPIKRAKIETLKRHLNKLGMEKPSLF